MHSNDDYLHECYIRVKDAISTPKMLSFKDRINNINNYEILTVIPAINSSINISTITFFRSLIFSASPMKSLRPVSAIAMEFI